MTFDLNRLFSFADARVRERGVRWLSAASPAYLLAYIPQLVEALRFEAYENSALSRYLLQQSTRHRSFAFELYWRDSHSTAILI